jgi:predicted Zn-dependent protease
MRFIHLRRYKSFILTCLFLFAASCDNTSADESQMLNNAKDYLNKGDLLAASIELRNALQNNTKNAEARYLPGNINLKICDLTGAEKELRRAAEAGWSQEAVQLQLARVLIEKKHFRSYSMRLHQIN